MTTICLMKTDKAIYLASDSQVTSGNIKLPDNYEKVEIFGETLIASCGSVGLCQKLSTRAYTNLKQNFAEAENFDKEPDVKDFAKALSDLNFYLPLEFKTFQSAGFLMGGLSNDELTGFMVGDDGSKIPIDTFATEGSGSQVALGVLTESYDKKIDVDAGAELIAGVINSAQKSDVYTSKIISVHAITKDGEYKLWRFNPEQVQTKPEEKQEDGQKNT